MADKSPQAFRTIREVADWLEVEAHALRFWESKFSQIKPVKRAGGRRYYRPSDMRLIGGIKTLLHDQGLTIRGVQKLIREEGVAHVAALSPPLDEDLDGIIEDRVADSAGVDEQAPQSGGFVDIDALAGDEAPVENASAPAEPEADTTPVETAPPPEPELEVDPPPEPLEIEPEPEPENETPDLAAMASACEDLPADAPPTPLSELRALLHAAVPFSLDQQQQLTPMVARLEALANRLDGRGPSA
ncbi:MerR family transcriptional regulator [Nioella ostreopsis]|uniref:MerR family transcriptional regulator n=1 Tax=Nioella ostreopsis TaxID=2448479 RepID=UPI000FDA8237|nr:MerR family transcriptional regulator [Nioella ostreopsis]